MPDNAGGSGGAHHAAIRTSGSAAPSIDQRQAEIDAAQRAVEKAKNQLIAAESALRSAKKEN